MDIPQIEKLVSEAIKNRPAATASPLNLYAYNGRLVCGARVVMPKNARFISHITPEIIDRGFNESEWKAVVEKTLWVLKDVPANPADSGDFRERRREERLKLSGGMWFNSEGDDKAIRGQLVDVSSRGMAFTCFNNGVVPNNGQQITARFSVPFFASEGVIQERKFARTAKVCRIGNASGYLKRVAVQFIEPLPFRPAEQEFSDSDVTVLSGSQV
ncbi:MAG: PilZ domain-containing protein [Sedimentisphaerales bacterium]